MALRWNTISTYEYKWWHGKKTYQGEDQGLEVEAGLRYPPQQGYPSSPQSTKKTSPQLLFQQQIPTLLLADQSTCQIGIR